MILDARFSPIVHRKNFQLSLIAVVLPFPGNFPGRRLS